MLRPTCGAPDQKFITSSDASSRYCPEVLSQFGDGSINVIHTRVGCERSKMLTRCKSEKLPFLVIDAGKHVRAKESFAPFCERRRKLIVRRKHLAYGLFDSPDALHDH